MRSAVSAAPGFHRRRAATRYMRPRYTRSARAVPELLRMVIGKPPVADGEAARRGCVGFHNASKPHAHGRGGAPTRPVGAGMASPATPVRRSPALAWQRYGFSPLLTGQVDDHQRQLIIIVSACAARRCDTSATNVLAENRSAASRWRKYRHTRNKRPTVEQATIISWHRWSMTHPYHEASTVTTPAARLDRATDGTLPRTTHRARPFAPPCPPFLRPAACVISSPPHRHHPHRHNCFT